MKIVQKETLKEQENTGGARTQPELFIEYKELN